LSAFWRSRGLINNLSIILKRILKKQGGRNKLDLSGKSDGLFRIRKWTFGSIKCREFLD
jgi:hypothetical protein